MNRCRIEPALEKNGDREAPVIRWLELTPGTLVKRYKRFLADVLLDNGETVTVHCPNPGSMKGCRRSGSPVYLSRSDNPRRKLEYTWELMETTTSLVGVNSLLPNRLMSESIRRGLIRELGGYRFLKSEVRVGESSRLDFLLSDPEKTDCYLEVKNCTMVREGVAAFPDAITARGRKHLIELQKLRKRGARCVMFFLIQRMDAEVFRPAAGIDPEYARELGASVEKGVEVIVYDTDINLEGISLNRKIPAHVI